MAEERKITKAEVRKTIAASLATAFGLVIALLWNQVVMGGLKVAGIDTTFATINLMGWIGYMVVAVVLTLVMIVFIIMFSRWGSKI
jgi:hypothetical protein